MVFLKLVDFWIRLIEAGLCGCNKTIPLQSPGVAIALRLRLCLSLFDCAMVGLRLVLRFLLQSSSSDVDRLSTLIRLQSDFSSSKYDSMVGVSPHKQFIPRGSSLPIAFSMNTWSEVQSYFVALLPRLMVRLFVYGKRDW